MALHVKIAGFELGQRRARGMLDSVIEQQQQDSQLSESLAPVWDQLKRTKMTTSELEKATAGLVARAADIRSTDRNFKDFGALQQRYRAAAFNDEDHAILDSIDTQGKIAHDMILSNNPAIQEQGRALFGQVFSAQRDFATKNEEQKIAAENTLGSQRWQEFSALQDNYRAESQTFLQQRTSYGKMKAALSLPDSAAGDLAVIYNYMKTIDPTSAVLPGEAANAQNMQGVPDVILTAYNNLLRGGQRLTPEQRRDFFKQAGAVYQQGRAEQVERDSRYLGQARDVGIPEKMLGHFVFPLDSPGESPSDFGNAAAAGGAAARPAEPSRLDVNPASTAPDTRAQMAGEAVATGVGELVRGAGEFVRGALGLRSSSRNTDEFAPPRKAPATEAIPPDATGQINGVYVPPFLRPIYRRPTP